MNSHNNSEVINIRPGVSILSVLRHLNYRPWFAIAEFVDNAVQSFLDHREALVEVEGPAYRLTVSIEINQTDGTIAVRDNAAGIYENEYPRAFRPAAIPPDRSGLSEFGMGMKSAACWFAQRWSVRTSALGEPVERTVYFDVDEIVRDSLEELSINIESAAPSAHYTEIVLSDLNQRIPATKTLGKIKEHIASIYRVFLRRGDLVLELNGEQLSYSEPDVLYAPYYENLAGEHISWQKEIDFDFGGGLSVRGFAALREVGSVSGAGFSLFRRDRVIEGSGDEGYRPEYIFKKSNSYTYQRLFGELHLEGFEISHTKDGFRWEENEEAFLELLKEELDHAPVPLLAQAEGHRVRGAPAEIRAAADAAAGRIARTVRASLPGVLEIQLATPPDRSTPPASLPLVRPTSRRVINMVIDNQSWQIVLELSEDPAIGNWVDICEHLVDRSPRALDESVQIGIRVSLAHPFMVRFAGTDSAAIEALSRVAAAIVVAEVIARRAGVPMAGTVRRETNRLLREVLSRP